MLVRCCVGVDIQFVAGWIGWTVRVCLPFRSVLVRTTWGDRGSKPRNSQAQLSASWMQYPWSSRMKLVVVAHAFCFTFFDVFCFQKALWASSRLSENTRPGHCKPHSTFALVPLLGAWWSCRSERWQEMHVWNACRTRIYYAVCLASPLWYPAPPIRQNTCPSFPPPASSPLRCSLLFTCLAICFSSPCIPTPHNLLRYDYLYAS